MILLNRHFLSIFPIVSRQEELKYLENKWHFLLHYHFERVMYVAAAQFFLSLTFKYCKWTNTNEIANGMKALFRGFILLHGLKSFHPHNLKVALKVSMFESTMIRLKKVLNLVWLFFIQWEIFQEDALNKHCSRIKLSIPLSKWHRTVNKK